MDRGHATTKTHWSLGEMRIAVGHWAPLTDTRSDGLRESAGWLTDLATKILHDRIGQSERLSLLNDLET